MKSERILIIDDHALIVEGYKNVLLLDNERYEIDTAFSCEEGFSKLEIARSHGFYYDIICLDMNLPAYDEMSILSGEDLGLLARKWFPKTKLVVLTMYNDNYRLYNIMKSLEPESFLLKRDSKKGLGSAYVDGFKWSIKNNYDNHPYKNFLKVA